MKKNIVFFLVLCCANIAFAQNLHTIRGNVKSTDGDSLPTVSVYLKSLKKGTITNEDGDFILSEIPKGTYELEVSFVGFETVRKIITVQKKVSVLNITLSEKVEKLDEVVVATDLGKVAKRNTTITVDVVNSKFINENLGGSLMQTLGKLGGVNSVNIGSGQSKPVIRGLSFNRILVAEKGLKHEGQQWGADHGLEIDQYDVQNVEVLKGPSSLRFGSDAIGGVIHLKRHRFPEKNSLHGEANTSYMSNNQSFSGSVQLEKRSTHFLLGARATGITYGDYRVPTDYVNVYDYRVPLHEHHLRNTAGNEYSFHLHTGYVSQDFHSVFYFSNYNAKSGFFANAHGLEPRRVDNSAYDASNTDIDKPLQQVRHFKITNETVWKMGKHNLKALLGYQKNIREEKGGYVSHGYMPSQFPATMPMASDLERKFDKDFIAVKLTDGIRTEKHKMEFGMDANYQKNTIDGWGFIIPNFKQFALGGFAIDTYKINDEVKLTAGLRYDYGRINIEQYQDWFASKTENGITEHLMRVADFDKGFQNISASVGLIYNHDAWTLKTNLGNSFRMPIAKELAANGVNYHYFRYERGNSELSPEKSIQWDVNLGWDKRNFTVELSPFVSYFPSYIYLNPTAAFDLSYGAGNQVFNYTQSRVFRYGGELHLHTTLLEHFEVNSISEYVKSRQLNGAKKGYGLPFSPPFSTNLGVKYTLNSFKFFQNPFVSFDYKYTARQTDIVPPEKITDSYQLVHLGMGTSMRFGKYRMQFNFQVKNLLDTKYFNHINFYRLIDLPEQGRNFLASVKLTF